MRTITITPALLERAGKAKKRFPCGANIAHGRAIRADVAFRTWHDSYNLWDKNTNEWLASFDDCSGPGHKIFTSCGVRTGVRLTTRGFAKAQHVKLEN